MLSFLASAYYDDVLVEKPPMPDGVELVAATDDDKVAGLIDVSVDGTAATIESIAVHPDHCRQGIATALLDRALDELAARGVRRIEAWTREDEAANGWYRARGFTESQHYLHVYARGNEEIARAVTEKEGLLGVHAFLHLVDMDREAEMRERFGRVYVCRCYARAV